MFIVMNVRHNYRQRRTADIEKSASNRGASASFSPHCPHREHPIGDKSFQSYIRQQSETPAHSM